MGNEHNVSKTNTKIENLFKDIKTNATNAKIKLETTTNEIDDLLKNSDFYKQIDTNYNSLVTKTQELIDNPINLYEKTKSELVTNIDNLYKEDIDINLGYAPEAAGAAFTASNGTIYKGQTYDLTDEEVAQIARLCYAEQGANPKAIAAEASLLANLYEHKNSTVGLVNYASNSGWFADRSVTIMEYGVNSNDIEYYENKAEYEMIVKDVLENGNRTIPDTVVEHDYKGDIISATNYGVPIDVWDNSQYIPGVTLIKNSAGATYTFYCFFDEDDPQADPFGYF